MPEPDTGRLERVLNPAEAERFAQFKRPERQRQFLLGRMLLRQAISHAAAIAPMAVGIIEQPGAAPLLTLPENAPRPAFSLSHSRHWIACATSRDAVLGIDIEVMDARRDVLALADAAFDAGDCAFLRKHSEAERIPVFYRIWTMQEALFKLWSNAEYRGKPPTLTGPGGELQQQGDGWSCALLEHPQLAIAICSTVPLTEITRIEPVAFDF